MPDPSPSKSLYARIRAELDDAAARGLARTLRSSECGGRAIERGGRTLINFAGNDYLALAGHPKLVHAACEATERLGVGAGASRLVTGHLALHEEVEAKFARFKLAQAAILLPTGYHANLAAVTALVRAGHVLCLDKLCHASLIDATRLSGALVRIFPHGNLDKLARLLERTAAENRQRWIVTDSVFSMDGDVADLPAMCALAERFDAGLIVDEAHGTGVLGGHGRGLCELQGVCGRVDAVVSTASKALGGLGGVVTGRREVIDAIIQRARPFIYTTAVPPAQAAVIGAAIEVIEEESWRRTRLLELAGALRQALAQRGLLSQTLHGQTVVTPIVPVIVGDAHAAVRLAAHLEARGVCAPAIRPPTVAPGAARVRLTLRADHEDADIAALLEAIDQWFAGEGSALGVRRNVETST